VSLICSYLRPLANASGQCFADRWLEHQLIKLGAYAIHDLVVEGDIGLKLTVDRSELGALLAAKAALGQ